MSTRSDRRAVLMVTALAACQATYWPQAQTVVSVGGTHTVRGQGYGIGDVDGARAAAHQQAIALCPWGYDIRFEQVRDTYGRLDGGYPGAEVDLVVTCRSLPAAPAAPAIAWGSGFYCTRHLTEATPDVCTRSYDDCDDYRGVRPLTPCTWTSAARCFLIYPHGVERCSVAPAACDQYRADEMARGSSTSVCIDAR